VVIVLASAVSSSLDDAVAAFNRGQYFDAAELFEKSVTGIDPELKDLAGALNRIAAAMHLRFERGGRQATINLLSQAMLTLDDMKPAKGGIDTARLFDEIYAFTEEIRAAPRDERSGLKHRARIFLERRRAPKINRAK
jgi:tetratricopeptide (TPR) repeat protein